MCFLYVYDIVVSSIITKADSLTLLPDEGSILLVLEDWGEAAERGRGVVSAREKSWLKSS